MVKLRLLLPHVILAASLILVSAAILLAVHRGMSAQVQYDRAAQTDASLVLLVTALALALVYGAIAFLAWKGKMPQDQ
jgi:hypothetical protein